MEMSKELNENFELLFEALDKVMHNQEQIINGIVALANKEGMEIVIKDYQKGAKAK